MEQVAHFNYVTYVYGLSTYEFIFRYRHHRFATAAILLFYILVKNNWIDMSYMFFQDIFPYNISESFSTSIAKVTSTSEIHITVKLIFIIINLSKKLGGDMMFTLNFVRNLIM